MTGNQTPSGVPTPNLSPNQATNPITFGASRVELIRATTGLLWVLLALTLVLVLAGSLRPAISMLAAHVDSLSVGPEWAHIEVKFQQLAEGSADMRAPAPLKNSELIPLQKRAMQVLPRIYGRRILWVDSNFPRANQKEISSLTELGFSIDMVKTTAEAMSAMSKRGYDLLITNMKRDDDFSGRRLMDNMCYSHIHIPGIIYSWGFNPEAGVPLNAVGAAASRAQLLQMIFDTAELGFPLARCLPAWCTANDTSQDCTLSASRAYGSVPATQRGQYPLRGIGGLPQARQKAAG